MIINTYVKYKCEYCNTEYDIEQDCIDCEASCYNNTLCTHRDKDNCLTIKYECSYEMRSRDMYCTQCDKRGSRYEFENGFEDDRKTVSYNMDKLIETGFLSIEHADELKLAMNENKNIEAFVENVINKHIKTAFLNNTFGLVFINNFFCY